MRLLLVEDDGMLGRAISKALTAEGYVVDWMQDGLAARKAVAEANYELILLDLGLPGEDGIQVLTQLRASGLELPVLVLTARTSIHDRIIGLDAGADDYLPKPFALDELSARIRALLRRSGGRGHPVFRHLGLQLDPVIREVRFGKRLLKLTKREYTLLHCLVQQPTVVRSRQHLLDALYGDGEVVESNTIEVYIHGLRRKLGDEFIVTVRGAGYRLADESELENERAD